jgi:hypothetical protein
MQGKVRGSNSFSVALPNYQFNYRVHPPESHIQHILKVRATFFDIHASIITGILLIKGFND